MWQPPWPGPWEDPQRGRLLGAITCPRCGSGDLRFANNMSRWCRACSTGWYSLEQVLSVLSNHKAA